ncbi:MAG: hypothetical protein WHS63_13130, partial [Tenuifilum sp.]|uniref:hypothetical protein n=1 Tax=Tenuifilum sp. TaxID=2760880 RepID=UPI0030A526C8
MKTKNLLTTMALTLTLLLAGKVGWGQQVIGTFPRMDGGFENQSGTLATAGSISSQQDYWTTQIAGTGIIFSSGGRSGPKFVQYSQTGTTHRRLQSPTDALRASTSYVVQFYYQGDLDGTIGGDNLRAAVSAAGTGNPGTYSTYLNSVNVGLNWTKFTAIVSTSSTAPTVGLGIISVNNTAQFNIDDFVIYLGTVVDETAPNSPGSVTITDNSINSLKVSWDAAADVDGGGYVVIRFTSNPDPNWDPNQNGIYAVGNTIPNSGTVCYIGTSTSFTDNGLSPSTQYWYKVYTVDKAFNYSDESTGSGSTLAEPIITVSTSALSNFKYIIGSGPSAEQLFTVEGSDLTDNITITPPSNFEISLTSGSGFAGDPIVLNQSGGSVATTTIYVRLEAGLAAGSYNENITLTSTGAATKNVACSGLVYYPEPTNHVTDFTATVDGNSQITLTWTDATGGTLPTGYLVMANTTGTFTDPVDETPQADDTDMSDNAGVVNVSQGVGTYVWTGLTPNTTYYFKIYPYTNSGSLIDYKIDGVVPTDSKKTTNILPEPENHVTTFAVSGTVLSTQATLTWVDAVAGAQAPEGYVVVVNTTGTFTVADGTPIADDTDFSDDAGAINVAYGVQTASLNTLLPGKHYYAQIFPYTNSGASINYKTDGTVPQVEILTPGITVTSPNGGQTFFAGDNVTITWTSANMGAETIKYEAYVRDGLTSNWNWLVLEPALPNTGSFNFTIPADAKYGTQYKIRLTGNTSGATDESDAAFTIIATPSIYDIQSNNTGGASNWANNTVRIGGIVTAVKTGSTSFNMWLQDSAKAWNGVYVYGVNNSLGTIAQGDSVEVIGTVDEYNNLTEIKSVSYLNKINSGNTLPTPVDVTPAQAASEAYEGVLVKLNNVECTVADAGFGEFTVSDGTNTINVDDFLYRYTPTQGARYNITGVIDYSFGAFKLLPRSANDVESAQVKYT